MPRTADDVAYRTAFPAVAIAQLAKYAALGNGQNDPRETVFLCYQVGSWFLGRLFAESPRELSSDDAGALDDLVAALKSPRRRT